MTAERRASKQSVCYEIRVRGHLGRTMLGAFPALRAETSDEDTLLSGFLPDQAALHGVLSQIEALGLELLEVRRILPSPAADGQLPDQPPDKPAGNSGA
jgi:hypothetical protein